jgi:hypothetical protein
MAKKQRTLITTRAAIKNYTFFIENKTSQLKKNF